MGKGGLGHLGPQLGATTWARGGAALARRHGGAKNWAGQGYSGDDTGAVSGITRGGLGHLGPQLGQGVDGSGGLGHLGATTWARGGAAYGSNNSTMLLSSIYIYSPHADDIISHDNFQHN
ncbi:hypothetical protein ACJX0J_041956 [Zea mays]